MEFEWLQNGLPVQDTEQRFKEGSNLQFAAVDRHRDAGVFQCLARNVLTGEEARTANASFNIKCECGVKAARHTLQPRAACCAQGKALSWEGPRLGTVFPGCLLMLVWDRTAWAAQVGSSRIPLHLPCPSCPVDLLCLLCPQGCQRCFLLLPFPFVLRYCSKCALGTAGPFRTHLIPQRTAAQGKVRSLPCGCLLTPGWLEGICISKPACALTASSGYW